MGVISMPSVSLGWHHPLTDCGFRTSFTMGYSQRKWDRVGYRGGAGIWFHLLLTNPPSSLSACFVSGSHCWACIPHPVCFFCFFFLFYWIIGNENSDVAFTFFVLPLHQSDLISCINIEDVRCLCFTSLYSNNLQYSYHHPLLSTLTMTFSPRLSAN